MYVRKVQQRFCLTFCSLSTFALRTRQNLSQMATFKPSGICFGASSSSMALSMLPSASGAREPHRRCSLSRLELLSVWVLIFWTLEAFQIVITVQLYLQALSTWSHLSVQHNVCNQILSITNLGLRLNSLYNWSTTWDGTSKNSFLNSLSRTLGDMDYIII